MVRQIIAFCIFSGIVAVESLPAQQLNGSQSAYVQRMMSLDRNGDGALSPNELPRNLADMFKHDANNDKRLDKLELANVERAAMAARDDRPASEKPSRRTGKANRGNSGAIAGSPLDPQQILRFALTFDANKDGGLDAAELTRYANALAARRARGRRQEDAVPAKSAKPAESSKKTKGLGSPAAKDDPALPFGSR